MTQVTEVPRDGRPVYFCPTCTAVYSKPEEAHTCAAANTDAPLHEAGDIVVWRSGYTWHDGNPKWIARKVPKGSLHGDMDSFDFFMVVTAITDAIEVRANIGSVFTVRPRDAHKLCYHVKTLALKNGDPTGTHGWTTAKTHVPMYPVGKLVVPASVREEAKALVGLKTERLL